MRRDPIPDFPLPVPFVRGRRTEPFINLSRLPTDERRRVFAQLQQQQPELAGLLGRMRATFGPLTLHADMATAKALGVSDDRQ
ncbi:MAG: hypothetical protein ACOC0Q_09045 [Wenzhouxiangella sp.]